MIMNFAFGNLIRYNGIFLLLVMICGITYGDICVTGRSKGGQARAEQLGHDGYVEMGKKGGSTTNEQSGGDAAVAVGHAIDESKFTN